MKISELQNKNILIVGYGLEGKAVEQFLKISAPTSKITIADSSQGQDYLGLQEKFDLAIKSPGVYKDKVKIPYTTLTNIFFANVKGMVIGVTGTKGKSTTTTLIYKILEAGGLKAHLVGNIGKPSLLELLNSNEKEDIWVCELSSYQLSDIEYSPHISVIVSLFPEHMNYHGSVEAYYLAKERIVEKAIDKDFLVFNPEFERLVRLSKNIRAKAVPYISKLPFSENIIPLLGRHNINNVRAAITVAQILNLPEEKIEEAVKNFIPLRHRLQKVGTFNNITFYDDAISTTPQSTLAALSAIPNVGTLLLGGQDRGFDFSELVEKIADLKIPNLVFFPDSGEKIFNLLKDYPGFKPKILKTTSMEEAVDFCFKNTKKEMVCLLSTASPSYTVWKNFEEKGDLFQEYVKNYVQNPA